MVNGINGQVLEGVRNPGIVTTVTRPLAGGSNSCSSTRILISVRPLIIFIQHTVGILYSESKMLYKIPFYIFEKLIWKHQ